MAGESIKLGSGLEITDTLSSGTGLPSVLYDSENNVFKYGDAYSLPTLSSNLFLTNNGVTTSWANPFGGYGTSGQMLYTNGSAVYWDDAPIGSGGVSYSFSNGLTNTGGAVTLGGGLLSDVDIDVYNGYLNFYNSETTDILKISDVGVTLHQSYRLPTSQASANYMFMWRNSSGYTSWSGYSMPSAGVSRTALLYASSSTVLDWTTYQIPTSSSSVLGSFLYTSSYSSPNSTLSFSAFGLPTSTPSESGQPILSSSTTASTFAPYRLPETAQTNGRRFMVTNTTTPSTVEWSTWGLPTAITNSFNGAFISSTRTVSYLSFSNWGLPTYGAAGKILQSGGLNTTASWTSYTMPTSSASTSGMFLTYISPDSVSWSDYALPPSIAPYNYRPMYTNSGSIVFAQFGLPSTAPVSSGKFIISNGSSSTTWSPYKMPTSVGSANKILVSNGTDAIWDDISSLINVKEQLYGSLFIGSNTGIALVEGIDNYNTCVGIGTGSYKYSDVVITGNIMVGYKICSSGSFGINNVVLANFLNGEHISGDNNIIIGSSCDNSSGSNCILLGKGFDIDYTNISSGILAIENLSKLYDPSIPKERSGGGYDVPTDPTTPRDNEYAYYPLIGGNFYERTVELDAILKIRRFVQATPPTTTQLPSGYLCMWIDSDNNNVLLCYNREGTIRYTHFTLP